MRPQARSWLIPVVLTLMATAAPALAARRTIGDSNYIGDAAAIRWAMEDYAHAIQTLPADSVAARFTPDGELLLPGLATISGRAAIREFLAPMNAAFRVDSTSMASEVVDSFGTRATQWGTFYQVAGPRDGKSEPHTGRFAALWRYDSRQFRWLIARLMMQPLPSPAPLATPAPTPAPGK